MLSVRRRIPLPPFTYARFTLLLAPPVLPVDAEPEPAPEPEPEREPEPEPEPEPSKARDPRITAAPLDTTGSAAPTPDAPVPDTASTVPESAPPPVMAASELTAPADVPATAKPGEFDIVATYNRLLAEDPDLTKPVAAIEALIDLLRHTTTSSTTMETWEITKRQVARLHAAVPNSLPIEAGTTVFSEFLSSSMRQPVASSVRMTASATLDNPLDSFDKIRQHLIDNSQLFAQRAKEARDRMADRGCRLVGRGDVVLTAGGSRAVRSLLLKAADRLRDTSVSSASPFTVLYVCDERARSVSDRAVAILRAAHLDVYEIDPSAVAYALEAHNVRSVFVGSEAVTHDGKLVSRIGTYQLAVLAQAAHPPRNVYALAETHKFVRKLLLGNKDLPRIGILQGFVPAAVPPRAGVPVSTKPALPYEQQVDVTPPSLVTNLITENGIIEPSSAYRIVSS